MLLEEDGLWYASEGITFNNANLGNVTALRTTFLEKARKLHAPEVTDLYIRLSGTVGGHTATALGVDAPKLIKQLLIRDDEEWCKLSGASIRIVEQMEFGSKQVDVGAVASAATSSTYSAIMRITFAPPKAHRPRDFHVPLINFLDAGEVSIQQCTAWPTGWTTSSSLTCKVFARVVEGRKREVKSRRKLDEIAYNQDDSTWSINGSLRGLYLSSVLATTGYTALTGITALNSTTLEFPPDLPPQILEELYRQNSDHLSTADSFDALDAIPLVQPFRGQKVGGMVDHRNVHLKFGATPTSAVLIRDVVVDRPPEITAKGLGYASVAQYQQDLVMRGKVRDGKPGGSPTRGYNATLVRRMPVRIDRGEG